MTTLSYVCELADFSSPQSIVWFESSIFQLSDYILLITRLLREVIYELGKVGFFDRNDTTQNAILTLLRTAMDYCDYARDISSGNPSNKVLCAIEASDKAVQCLIEILLLTEQQDEAQRILRRAEKIRSLRRASQRRAEHSPSREAR